MRDASDTDLAELALSATVARRRREAYRRLGTRILCLVGERNRERVRDAAHRIARHHGYHRRAVYGLSPHPHTHAK